MRERESGWVKETEWGWERDPDTTRLKIGMANNQRRHWRYDDVNVEWQIRGTHRVFALSTSQDFQRRWMRRICGLNLRNEGMWERYSSRRSKLNNGSSREIRMVITFHSDVRFGDIIYQDARNWTTEALEKFKWSYLFTLRSNSGTSHIEMLQI